jgi:hypothetical protein
MGGENLVASVAANFSLCRGRGVGVWTTGIWALDLPFKEISKPKIDSSNTFSCLCTDTGAADFDEMLSFYIKLLTAHF